ncbi:hypothetical protein FN846DRAFT_892095 [Sphaerosporella brunnea]|uniref:F-box domain-containing protein n=1 Tax=Sphaerosporella brunnea TaxID=1250544 RepID=A0A5J5ERF0_9PEZI|nr:hypothetical protein FN846DRAFT_892095 [Sphaerosporella brunnea]
MTTPRQRSRSFGFSAVLGTKIISAPPASPPASPVSPSCSFTTYRVRVYAKDGRDYRYTEIGPTIHVPAIEISPPEEAAAGFLDPRAMLASRASTFPESEGHRRARSVDANKPLPPLPHHQRRVSAPALGNLDTSCGTYQDRAVSTETTPPSSPAESFSVPERYPSPPFRLPPSPPVTPHSPVRGMSQDSLPWLSLELATPDGDGSTTPNEKQPFIDFSPPTSPFECEFPEFFPPGETRSSIMEMYSRVLLSLPEEVLFNIFVHLPTATEVTSLALAHPKLYRIFKANSAEIVSNVANRRLYPALRHLLSAYGITHSSFSTYEATLKHFCTTTTSIKAAIRKRCSNFLSKHLLTPMSFHDDEAFDEAILNVWGFSVLFSSRIGEKEAQVAWLKSRNFSIQELKDLLEVYQCIGVLLGPLTSDISLAVKAGVVEELGEGRQLETEEAVELWAVWLQTLDLQTLRPVIEVPEEDEAGRWDAIVRAGLWRWNGKENRMRVRKNMLRLHLKGAVGEVYKELSERERRGSLEEKWGPESLWGATCEF